MNNFCEFGQFRIDRERRLLLRQGEPVTLSNKAFDLLLALVENRDRVMDKDELLDTVWAGTIVEENNLTVAMSGLRKALGEGPADRRFIMTVTGKGYRFVAEVSAVPSSHDASTDGSPALGVAAVLEPAVLPVPAVIGLAPGRGISRWLAVVLIAAALAGVLAYTIWKKRRANTTLTSIHSLAVLPFKSIAGGDRGDQYLGVGLADAVNSKLSRLEQLKVRPIGSVSRYERDYDPVTAGKELKVDAVLDGQIQHSGQRIRLTVQLIAVRDGATLWDDTIDQPFTNVFAVEDSISTGVAQLLAPQLSRVEKETMARRYTKNPEAYQLYLKGRYLWDKNTEEPMLKSLEYFKQAIAADPSFASAYIGIADAYSDLAIQGYVPGTIAFPEVKNAAMKALAIDPALAEPHNSLGVVAWAYDWDWATAGAEFQRAAALNPESVATHIDRGFYLLTMRRFDESVSEGEHAAALNPASASVLTAAGYFNFAAQDYPESIAWLGKALDLDPDEPFARAVLAANYALSGKRREALAEYAKLREVARSGNDPLVSSIAGYACAVAGNRQEALLLLTRLLEPPPQRYVDPYAVATLYSGLGEHEKGLVWLERTYQQRSASVVFLNFDPPFLAYRGNPQFRELLRRAGLPD
jgi:DNA-binding winged helix-turn-helix (wHTH) protein/TolB-like protein/tetratricopeptide (TPR) repeat protein